jgi:hypothetical protein
MYTCTGQMSHQISPFMGPWNIHSGDSEHGFAPDWHIKMHLKIQWSNRATLWGQILSLFSTLVPDQEVVKDSDLPSASNYFMRFGQSVSNFKINEANHRFWTCPNLLLIFDVPCYLIESSLTRSTLSFTQASTRRVISDQWFDGHHAGGGAWGKYRQTSPKNVLFMPMRSVQS